jgi:transposase
MPRLETREIVAMSNLGANKIQRVRELIEGATAQLLRLLPTSPDFKPIEQCWGKPKKVGSLEARTVDSLQEAIAEAIVTIKRSDAAAWFCHCGYELQ